MTLVLDAGGLSALAGDRARLAVLRSRGVWPPVVPVVVLVESLIGDHRRDFATNRVLGLSLLVPVDETASRRAAFLRTRSGRADEISAVDALVVAVAMSEPEPTVLTSDPRDLKALAEHADSPVQVARV